VDLPINSMVMFHSYVSLPEGTFSVAKKCWSLFNWENWSMDFLTFGKAIPQKQRHRGLEKWLRKFLLG